MYMYYVEYNFEFFIKLHNMFIKHLAQKMRKGDKRHVIPPLQIMGRYIYLIPKKLHHCFLPISQPVPIPLSLYISPFFSPSLLPSLTSSLTSSLPLSLLLSLPPSLSLSLPSLVPTNLEHHYCLVYHPLQLAQSSHGGP